MGAPQLGPTTLMVCIMSLFTVKLTCAQIDCFSCVNVTSSSQCNSTQQCGTNERCYTEVAGGIEDRTYTFGCLTETACLNLRIPSLVGRSNPDNTGSQDVSCQQCCGVDGCNSVLCADVDFKPVTNATCADDPTFDCWRMSSFSNFCADRQHAKIVCRKFCGFCNLVDGGWSNWSTWSDCSVTCEKGLFTRSRTCTYPAPAHGGHDCVGKDIDTTPCVLSTCPVQGSWGMWSPWGSCSTTCGVGLRRRDRSCSNPYPALGGDHCFGDSRDDRICFTRACADGGWSTWSNWSTCSVTCDTGMTKRNRTCDNPVPSQFGRYCPGDTSDSMLCSTASCIVNGGWNDWSVWGICSESCGVGLKSRDRTCTNPIPSDNGHVCIGNNIESVICHNHNQCPSGNMTEENE